MPAAAAPAFVSVSDWLLGVLFSVAASVIGGASKLAIRKSWLVDRDLDRRLRARGDGNGAAADALLRDGYEPPLDGLPPAALAADDDDDDDDEGEGETRRDGAVRSGGALYVADGGDCDGDCDGDDAEAAAADCDRVDRCDGASDPFSDDGGLTSTPPPPGAAESIRRRAWALRLAGMVGMTFLNPLCCVFAMNFASPSLLAPFSGLTLVWIVIFSDFLIGERPLPMQVAAAGLIVLGEVVVSVWGDHTSDENATLEQVAASYGEPSLVAYFVGVSAWMALLAYWMVRPPNPSLRRFAWGVSSGSITGLQNFLKDSLTVIKCVVSSTPPGHPPSPPWYLFLMLFLAFCCAFGGLLLLTACMRRYDATYSSAAFVGSFIISASIMCQAHYHTLANLRGAADYVMYPLGLAVLLAGVLVLVRETKDDADDGMEWPEPAVDDRSSQEGWEENGPSVGMTEPLVPRRPAPRGSGGPGT